MPGSINAIGLITTIFLTIFILWKLGSRPEGIKQVIVAIISPLLLFLLGTLLSFHCCNAGVPFTQLVIPAICLGCIIAFIRDIKIQKLSGLAIIVMAIILSDHFLNLVHTADYTGSPQSIIRDKNRFIEHNLMREKEILRRKSTNDDYIYPSGWIESSGADRESPFTMAPQFSHLSTYKTYPYWHSFITGLYGKKSKIMDIWYPGGRIKDNIDKIEFRERPELRWLYDE
jgi:hypothetical protein